MLDITFRQTEDELYELKAQFGRDVDPDALLSSISSLLEMVKRTFPATQRAVNASNKQGKKERLAGQAGGGIKPPEEMPDAAKALLVSLFEYEQEHQKPVLEIWDIRKYAQKFSAYEALMQNKNREQEVTALRYQLRLLRDRGVVEGAPDRSLTPFGIELAKQFKPVLKRIEASGGTNDDDTEPEQQVASDTAEQELSLQSEVQRSDGRLHSEHS